MSELRDMNKRVAKQIRCVLKNRYPGQKFSVTTGVQGWGSTYIRIRWDNDKLNWKEIRDNIFKKVDTEDVDMVTFNGKIF